MLNVVKFEVVEMVFRQTSYNLFWVVSLAPQSFTWKNKTSLKDSFFSIFLLSTCPHKVTQFRFIWNFGIKEIDKFQISMIKRWRPYFSIWAKGKDLKQWRGLTKGIYVECQLCNNYICVALLTVSLHSLFLENIAQIGF